MAKKREACGRQRRREYLGWIDHIEIAMKP